MFAKLKKKIVDEQGGGGSDPGKNPLVLPGQGNSRQNSVSSPASKDKFGYESDSGSSIQSPTKTEEAGDMVGTREEVMNLLIRRSEQCKKLETKISEYAAIIKEKNKAIEKLEDTLEKQQDASAKRVQELNEQYQLGRAKLSEGFTLALQKKDEEKEVLEEKLKEFEEDKNKMFEREEEKEELQGLAAQELAKVKHLLLKTEEELSTAKADLEEKARQFKDSEKKLIECNNILQEKSKQLEEHEQTCALLTEENSSHTELVGKLTTEKQKLEERIHELLEDQKEKMSALSFLESTKTDLENDHQTLLHNHEVHKTKTSKQLEEKDESIEKLQERIHMLEQRFQDQNLSGDDRVKAMELERDSLEKKLEEARHQLTEIKSSWSEKITHHEQQIAHLNEKIMEDKEERLQVELGHTEKMNASQKQMTELKSKLEDAEKRAEENWQLANKKDQLYDIEKHDLETKLNNLHFEKMDLENQLRAKIDSLEAEIFNSEEQITTIKSETGTRITELESKERELLDKCRENESQIKTLKEQHANQGKENTEKDGINSRLQENLNQEVAEKNALLEKVSSLEEKVRQGELDMESDRNALREKEKELSRCSQEKDELCLRNAELSQQIMSMKKESESLQTQSQEEVKERNQQIKELEESIKELEKQLDVSYSNVQSLEEKNKTNEENNSQILKLENLVADLQNQVSDKNKELKKKEQRLTDLKKTLQRELKLQAMPNEENTSDRSQSPLRDQAAENANSRLSPLPSPVIKKENLETKSRSRSPPKVHEMNHLLSTSPAVLEDISVTESNASLLYRDTHTSVQNSRESMNGQESVAHTAADMNSLEKDINFQYLKHVILKFMLSRESEAVHLIRAVSVLLKFTAEEQKLIRETLEWKMSWFGPRPLGGGGQRAKYIPPTV